MWQVLGRMKCGTNVGMEELMAGTEDGLIVQEIAY